MRITYLLLLLPVVFFSCKKEKAHAGEKVEIFLLKEYPSGPGPCKVDADLARLQADPLISNEDIRSYSVNKFRFRLKKDALEKIKNLMGRTPFAVTVDRQVIYYGFYMPLILSSTCDQSVTMHENLQDEAIVMQLGYPVLYDGMDIVDNRNDRLLLETLSAQGKLLP